MEVNLSSVFISFVTVTFLSLAWRLFNWVWLKPKQLERCLRKQGFKGNPYKLLFGDFKQIMSALKEAKSKSMDASSNDIMPLMMPLHRPFVNLYGNITKDITSLDWKLPNCKRHLNEVLRLYPPVSYIYRRIHKTTRLGELHLPQGVNVLVPTIAIHQDPELWGEDAKEFKPERFSEGIAKATKGQSIFLPFGGGPRVCIGQNFAMLEAKMALAVILRNFEFELSPSYIHAPSLVIIIEPKHGVQLILRKI